jgi:hypothetical protein
MFIDNKYTKWYNSIIYKAQHTEKLNSYTERHHIVPRSLGGSNAKSNIVRLTAREHFICHVLLTKMTTGTDNIKMVHAAIGMKRSRSYQNRYVNSRLYESLKTQFATISRERNTGKKATAETLEKMSRASKGKPKTKEHAENISKGLTGYKRGTMSDVERKKRSISNKGKPSPNKGNKGKYKHTQERKDKISENNRKRTVSEETKKKIGESLKAYNESKKLNK